MNDSLAVELIGELKEANIWLWIISLVLALSFILKGWKGK